MPELRGRHMTLSHRWGSANNILKLQRSNYERLCAGFPIAILPQCFQDAIEVTRFFDVQYLWIDSLCIFQDEDDLGDWIRESSIMMTVYASSMLNISSLAAKDSSHSFFSRPNPVSAWVPEVDIDLERLGVGSGKKRFAFIDAESWWGNISDASLNQRAWVLQERLLAPRVLHSGRNGLAWECNQLNVSEVFPEGLPSITQCGTFKALNPQQYSESQLSLDSPSLGPRFESYRMWRTIVHNYTLCSLTKSRDKLVALSGVAKHFLPIVNDKYVAGMWLRHLHLEILWYTRNNDLARRQPDYRAPSWSWASTDGEVILSEPDERGTQLDVIETALDYATRDPTGELRAGSLLLDCNLTTLRLHHQVTSREDGFTLTVGASEFCDINYLRVYLDESIQYFDPSQHNGGDLYCAPAHFWNDEDRNAEMVILLLQVVDSEQGTFRRIGIAIANDRTGVASVLAASCGLTPTALPCVRRAGERYVIRLI